MTIQTLRTLATSGVFVLWLAGSSAAADGGVTFSKDVMPILQKNCQSCHRPGEVAPMTLMTYEETRPWARAIKQAVMNRKMPPWFADPHYGRFSNAPRLSEADIQTIAAWADAGAPAGDPKHMPAPIQWPEGWHIKPDAIASMPEPFRIPAKGTVELTSFTIPTGFTTDTWITSIEVRPGNPAVVHHVVLSFVPHRDDVKYGVPRFLAKDRDEEGVQIKRITKDDDRQRRGVELGRFTNLETVYVPGTPPLDFRMHNAAKLIPAGYDISIQLHYTPIGKETTDQTRVGFTVAREEPARRFITMSPTSPHDAERFTIPAGDPNWESTTEVEFKEDGEIVWFMPHMHLRGKDMTYRLTYPDGRSEIVLSVPRYDFEWQLAYYVEKPISVPKGTRLHVTAHYDNSANNKFNPNSNRPVWWGDQTWEEMMVPWFGVVVDKKLDPSKIMAYTTEAR
jgi:hypothetical protein